MDDKVMDSTPITSTVEKDYLWKTFDIDIMTLIRSKKDLLFFRQRMKERFFKTYYPLRLKFKATSP